MRDTAEFKRVCNNLRAASQSSILDRRWRTVALSTVFYEVLLGKPELYEGENELADRFERLWEFSNSVATVQHDLFTHFQTDEARVKATGMCLESMSGFWKWWFAHASAEQQNKHGKELLYILTVNPAKHESTGDGSAGTEPGEAPRSPVIELGPLRMTTGVAGTTENTVVTMGEAWISSGTYARPPLRDDIVMTAEVSAAAVLVAFQSLPVTGNATLEVCIWEPMFDIISRAYLRSKQPTRVAGDEEPAALGSSS